MNPKKILFTSLLGVVCALSAAAQTKSKTAPVTKTTQVAKPPAQLVSSALDSLSYAIGVNIGENLKQQDVKPNTDLLAKAIQDVLQGQNLLMPVQECNTYIQSYFQNQYMNKAEENRKSSEAFLEKNKTMAGVMTLPSGLQYKVLEQGTGNKPVSTDKVRVNYEGKTIDGKVFDSSMERGTPAEFGLMQVIKGWTEALQLMPVGSKWELYIPADLAYGTQAPPAIGPNQTLIFRIDLLDIVTPAATTEE